MEALIIPWSLLLVGFVLVACLAKKWYKASAVLYIVLLLANWHWRVLSCGFHSLAEHKLENRLMVLTWNISCADATGTDDVEGLVEAIVGQDADVVFVTEYNRETKPGIDTLLSQFYPYKDDLPVWMMWGKVYSRFPIDSCRRVGGEENGSLFRFDVRYRKRMLPMYCKATIC